MKPLIRRFAIPASASAFMSLAILLAPLRASPQQPSPGAAVPDHEHVPDIQRPHPHPMMPHHCGQPEAGSRTPALSGQGAFAAVQEVVRLLDADPNTDWSKVNLEALRQHLIDMNEVALRANAAATPIPGGLEIAMTGEGRTLTAIQRMVPAHARELNRMNGWSAKAMLLPNGVRLTVTSTDRA